MTQGSTPTLPPDAPLYAARVPVFPRRVKGWFRSFKWLVMAVTLGIYYITPWIRWDRGPNLPDQAVLVDLANRRFFFFWIEIWPHEFYFVAGLLIMAGLGLFLFTSALGRVWCGYACPQTVWTDLFLLTERWVEGDRNARVRLYNAPWSLTKARLRLTKWAIWLAIAVATGGAWVFYFADAPTLLRDLVTGQAHPVAYGTMAVLTATTFTFGGFFREQICIYACPWPRIQAAMMDEETITIGYRAWRGEPRGKKAKHVNPPTPAPEARARALAAAQDFPRGTASAGATMGGVAGAFDGQVFAPASPVAKAAPLPFEAPAAFTPDVRATGDCIDCMACVNVCPMGIDIRDGQQMACITCGLCIDACNEVMDRIDRPRGLIGYFTLTDERAERAGGHGKPVIRHILRPRTILYTTLWSLIGVGLIVALFIRSPIDITVAPVRNPTYVTLSDGTIRNAYDIRIRNKAGEARDFTFSLTSDVPLSMTVEGSDDLTVRVDPDATGQTRVYVEAAPGTPAATADRTELRLWIEDPVEDARAHADTHFNGAP